MYPLPKIRKMLNKIILILGNKTISERIAPKIKVTSGFYQNINALALFVTETNGSNLLAKLYVSLPSSIILKFPLSPMVELISSFIDVFFVCAPTCIY